MEPRYYVAGLVFLQRDSEQAIHEVVKVKPK